MKVIFILCLLIINAYSSSFKKDLILSNLKTIDEIISNYHDEVILDLIEMSVQTKSDINKKLLVLENIEELYKSFISKIHQMKNYELYDSYIVFIREILFVTTNNYSSLNSNLNKEIDSMLTNDISLDKLLFPQPKKQKQHKNSKRVNINKMLDLLSLHNSKLNKIK